MTPRWVARLVDAWRSAVRGPQARPQREGLGPPARAVLVLTDPGRRKIEVIAVVRRRTTLDLRPAKAVVDAAPTTVRVTVFGNPEDFRSELRAIGAVADVERV